jgi:hypothetical protein
VVSANLPEPDNITTPADICVTPVYEFAADNVSVPAPVFVNDPVEVAIAPEIVDDPTDSTVKPNVPDTPPDIDRVVPVSICTSAAAVNVTAPDHVLEPAVLRRAPPVDTPVPAR